ncbi:MAG: amidohydrolase [Deltaproteobacteria bacterium]|nr:amidohydrolase [Deltaproteobacteria bacterium]
MRVPPVRPSRFTPAQQARLDRRRLAGQLAGLWDSHVHLFPDAIYAALHRWFDAHAWHIRFRGGAEPVLANLAAAGARKVVALAFAHKAGVSRYLNHFLADLCRAHPQVIGVAAVLPGEPDDLGIVDEAIGRQELRGVKIHCHVSNLAIDDPRVVRVLARCAELRVPAVVHAGKEPSSAAYGVDTRTLCSVERTRAVLRRLPDLKLVVPHVGADEFAAYLALTRQFEGLYLDTAMACADYFDHQPDWAGLEACAERVLYGTDFPILPYEADREISVIAAHIGDDAAFCAIARDNAARFWLN